MRAFAKFPVKFWARKSTKEIRNTDPNMLLVAMYLLTNMHSNMIGLYHLPLPYIVHDTGLDELAVIEIMHKLRQIDFCDYDEHHEYVWIKEFAEDQTGLNLKPGDKRVRAIYKLLEDIPPVQCLQEFYDRYQKHYHLGKGQQDVLEAVELYHKSMAQQFEE